VATSKNVATGATTTLAASTGLATVNLPVGMWTAGPADPQDFLVLEINPVQPQTLATPGQFQFASTVIDVRLFWNLQRTDEHHFDAPIEIVMSDSSGSNAAPATFENGAWRLLPELPSSGPLPLGMQDGYWRNGATVHVLTRHLTMFGLLTGTSALQIAPPRDVAGVVADDGLTVRWAPGIPNEQIGNFFLYVDGRQARIFGQREFETKLGQITADDPRRFWMTETNLAGRESVISPVLRVVPPLAGSTIDEARAALAERHLHGREDGRRVRAEPARGNDRRAYRRSRPPGGIVGRPPGRLPVDRPVALRLPRRERTTAPRDEAHARRARARHRSRADRMSHSTRSPTAGSSAGTSATWARAQPSSGCRLHTRSGRACTASTGRRRETPTTAFSGP